MRSNCFRYELQGPKTNQVTESFVGFPQVAKLMSCVISGESVDDCGGGYSESIAEMCDELQNCSLLPLLIATPNGREESGTSRDDAR